MSDDLPQRLRDLYVSTGLPYLQWAANRIEILEAEKREQAMHYLSLDTQAQALMDKAEADEALMRQALDALEHGTWYDMPVRVEEEHDAAIAALRTRLGESSGAPVPVGLPAGEQTGPVAGAPTQPGESKT